MMDAARDPDIVIVCTTPDCVVCVFAPCDNPEPHPCSCPICGQPGIPAMFRDIGQDDVPVGLIHPLDLDVIGLPTMVTLPPMGMN